MTRDERQALCIKKWIANKGKGVVIAGTGFGKTKVGTNIIKGILNKDSTVQTLVVVPTIALKEQWLSILDKLGLGLNCNVEVINTVITKEWECDLLIIDEIHMIFADTFKQVFSKVKYKWILGLTATLERLDGKHVICKQYCPVVDNIPISECLANGWVSYYNEYQVIIDVDDIDVYKEYNKKFTADFEFFNFDWDKVNKCTGPNGYKYRYTLSKEMCPNNEEERKKVFIQITHHATSLMRVIQQRKSFINNHPKKLELCRKIIESRPFSKIITFSGSIKMAESIGIGEVYSGKVSKKKGRTTIEEFSNKSSGVLNTIKRADAGIDIPGLSVAIIIGTDSSPIKAVQRLGRTIRFENGKKAEIFNIVINDTVELKWFSNSHANQPYITIDEDGLNDVLQGKEPKPYVKKLKDFTFRY